MTVKVSFLAAVTIAGLAFVLGTIIVRHVPLLRRYFIPTPAVGGLLVALGVLILHIARVTIAFPLSGYDVDFLAGLLTANMGLHVTWKVLRTESFLFLVVLGLAVILYFVQLIVALPFAFTGHDVIGRAIIMGPLSFVGAPFNLNPPNQVPSWLAQLLQPAFPAVASIKGLAQGQMMIGVVIAIFLTGVVGRALFNRASVQPPRPDPDDRTDTDNVWAVTTAEVSLLVLILTLVTLSVLVQDGLLHQFPWLKKTYVPTIVLAYLFGVIFRLLWEASMPKPKQAFPKKALGILLFGPTMGLTLTYPLMGIPLYNFHLLSWPMVLAGFLSIAGSVVITWLAFPLFARFVDRYYAAVISTAFLGITTGWGPIGMVYLRRFTDEEGPVPPMPVILPLNAFFVIPWMVIGLSSLMIHLFG